MIYCTILCPFEHYTDTITRWLFVPSASELMPSLNYFCYWIVFHYDYATLFFYPPPACLHLIVSQYAIKSNASINIFGHVSQAHGNIFSWVTMFLLTMFSILSSSLLGFSSSSVTSFWLYPRRLRAHTGGVNVDKAPCLPLACTQLSGRADLSVCADHPTETLTLNFWRSAGLWCPVFHSH